MIRLGRRAESVAASWRMEAGSVISPNAAESSDRLGHKPSDHCRNGLAFGAGGKAQRPAVLERGLGQYGDIVERWRQASVDQRARANRQHQGLRGARAR